MAVLLRKCNGRLLTRAYTKKKKEKKESERERKKKKKGLLPFALSLEQKSLREQPHEVNPSKIKARAHSVNKAKQQNNKNNNREIKMVREETRARGSNTSR